MAFLKIDFDVDKKQFEDQLRTHERDQKKIARRMIGKALSEQKKQTKEGMVGNYHKDTGTLFRSIQFKTWADFTGELKVRAFYASYLEQGISIMPKKGSVLTFKLKDGTVRRARSVTVPARPFADPAAEEVWKTGLAERLMDQVFQEALDQIYGKEV